MILTESQTAAIATLFSMGRLFFSKERVLPRLSIRPFPLLVGPTGVGKSHLVERAAFRLGANFMRLTRGDWLVTGSKAERSTMFQVLDRLVASERLALVIDELDKFGQSLGHGDWGASIASDLWNLLDLRFNTALYLSETTFAAGSALTEADLKRKIRESLWIAGAGTWQDVFEQNRPQSRIGFNTTVRGVDRDAISASRQINPELLHRFSGDLIFLSYPSLEETEALLVSSGIDALAHKLGIRVSAGDVDWNAGGMRALETLATRLSLLHFERLHGRVRETRSARAI